MSGAAANGALINGVVVDAAAADGAVVDGAAAHVSDALVRASADERAAKRDRVLDVLRARDASSIVLRTPASLAWYLDGARTHVSLAGDPIAAVVVSRDGEFVVTTENERDRLVAEELPLGIPVTAVPWHRPLDEALPVGADVLVESDPGTAAALRAARASLLPAETQRFSALGRDCADVLTQVLPTARADEPEFALAGRVAGALVDRGIDPVVVLVGSEERREHRHPLPGRGLVGRRAMVVVCGRRAGLIANVTRWVRFTEQSAAERDSEARIRQVEAAFLAATIPGRSLDDVLVAGSEAYAAAGFDRDEWRRHHQGGAAGYNGRDPRATPGAADLVVPDQAFAWNPTAPGAKVEDTVMLTSDGFRVLTADGAWPTTRVGELDRPDELLLG